MTIHTSFDIPLFRKGEQLRVVRPNKHGKPMIQRENVRHLVEQLDPTAFSDFEDMEEGAMVVDAFLIGSFDNGMRGDFDTPDDTPEFVLERIEDNSGNDITAIIDALGCVDVAVENGNF